MTLEQFADIFALLAVQLRQTDADEVTIRAYFKALQDIEPELLAMAATRLADTAEWFPKTSEWREAAARIERERTDELAARLRKLPKPLCSACDDTGWARVGEGVSKCDCRTLRRLEVLGRRPMPALPEGESPAPDLTQIDLVRAMVAPALKGTR